MKNVISTDKAPAAIGPYSQAIEVNGMVYTSGVIPVVPETGEILRAHRHRQSRHLQICHICLRRQEQAWIMW